MEFAVSAIILLILLLPGFILQSAYSKGFWRWNSPTSTRTLTEQIPAAVVLASVLHALWATLAASLGLPVNLNAMVMLLTGSYGHDEIYFDTTVRALTGHPYKVFVYFISLYCMSALVGYVAHWVVRNRVGTEVLEFSDLITSGFIC
jgi:hypothetical protein